MTNELANTTDQQTMFLAADGTMMCGSHPSRVSIEARAQCAARWLEHLFTERFGPGYFHLERELVIDEFIRVQREALYDQSIKL